MTPTRTIPHPAGPLRIVDLAALGASHLPVIHRLLIENIVRHNGGQVPPVVEAWLEGRRDGLEIEFRPARIMMHDTTCGPALVDLAAARDAIAELGGDPARVNPQLRVDVSTDHSLAADFHGAPGAMARNMAAEMRRNAERFGFMRWAGATFDNFVVHPPGTGIMHTINLEQLATVVSIEQRSGTAWAMPDTLIGTDSHTPMINGIGVLGWGVGGLEAESVMLGMPVTIGIPEVLGVRLTGALGEGVTATDLALTLTARLRALPLADKFVEYFGPGVGALSAGERATVANMAPEYGAATGFFPVDAATLAYLAQTGRTNRQIALVREVMTAAGLWHVPHAEPAYDQVLEFDLSAVETALAGPHRPQDLVRPRDVPGLLTRPADQDPPASALPRQPIALAAITSCTNTSDPRQLITAGLVARNARIHGLVPPAWVKTVLAPGSPAAAPLLGRAGLLDDLEAVGFGIAGYGCTVCIGNSGPLHPQVREAVAAGTINPVAVLSGNRNFVGRVHRDVTDAFLASPGLVIAYALLGDASVPLDEACFTGPAGTPVGLPDLWPGGAEIDEHLARGLDPAGFPEAFQAAWASVAWAGLEAPVGEQYPWDPASTYLRRPPFVHAGAAAPLGALRARPLLVLGDDVTTDHISPAGAIPPDSAAGRWLVAHGADAGDLNVYSARRGNWEVMLRGLFTAPPVRNLLGPAIAPGCTVLAPGEAAMPLYRAARRLAQAGEAAVIVAGERYGTGSSRDWAAKGLALLGVRAVIARSFERIHRTNLINMGIVPLRLAPGRSPEALGIGPGDRLLFDTAAAVPGGEVPVTLERAGGARETIGCTAQIESAHELSVLRSGGMVPMIIRAQTAGGHPIDPAKSTEPS